jgi:DNA topoisomerase-1
MQGMRGGGGICPQYYPKIDVMAWVFCTKFLGDHKIGKPEGRVITMCLLTMDKKNMMQIATLQKEPIHIPKRQLSKLLRNYEESAKVAQLSYVNDTQEGIVRVKRGKNFQYFFGERKVEEAATLSRIKKMAIPPAWQNVWICPDENGHIQVVGYDALNRKQYRYHPHWVSLRDHTKYHRLRDFGRALSNMRKRLEQDIHQTNLTKEKVLAAIVSVMQSTSIRIGNTFYEKLYGSYGLSTMKDRHVHLNGNEVKFSFKGKKGIYHNISIKSKKLAVIINQCRDIPGQELFQYFDANGKRHAIDSGEVNEYIRSISGGDFTSKDFRTWTGSNKCLIALKELGSAENSSQVKKNILIALDKVAKHLGNTRTVCKKHYVHPFILSAYENGKLEKYWMEMEKLEAAREDGNLLSPSEQMVLKILEQH